MTQQLAYRIEVVVDQAEPVSVTVDSDQSVLRPWPFRALRSREAVRWRVQVRTGDGWSAWSDPARFETGLIDRRDWRGSLIGATDDVEPRPARGERGAIYFRRTFTVVEPLVAARAYATAHGIYELHLDGHRVGDLELTPGFTAYRSVLEVQTYDITDLCTDGTHTLVATVTDGWFRGSVGFTRAERSYGDRLGLLAQIELEHADGRRTTIGTDDVWEASTAGPIVAADLMEGEHVDQRISFPPDHGWRPVAALDLADDVGLVASPAPPTRVIETYEPSIVRLDDVRQVIDVGRNINGWLRIDDAALGPAGTSVRLVHGERLGSDGDVDMANLEVEDFMSKDPLGHGQVDQVVSGGGAAPPFEPRHTTHGFQYARIEGAPDLAAGAVRAAMVHSDLTRTGWFECSDPRLNALHDAAVLSFRGNACEIPTDCPHRERAGWTGDWQLFAPTAAFLYDVAGFSDRWLRDLAADQWPDGRVTNHVPDPVGPQGRSHTVTRFLTGSAGWGDAATLVPQLLWRVYEDRDLLERQYPSMVAWVQYGLRAAEAGRHATRVATRPVAAAHERFVWDRGFHWGEWCEPGVDGMAVFSGEVDQGHVATAYLARSLDALTEAATILGRDDDAATYAALASEVRHAWRDEFVDPDGVVHPHTQANLTRALAFDLVDDDQRARIVADLVALIEASGVHVGTGFLTTPFLLPTLADHGHLDLAYALLLQTTPPSWLSMIEAGATTIWENWEGVEANGQGSFNHYSKGAVVTFLHEHVAGIRPTGPGYRTFDVRPRPGGGLTSAEATFDSPYGRIRSAWSIDAGRLHAEVVVPPGTSAQVVLPDGTTHSVGPGTHRFDSGR